MSDMNMKGQGSPLLTPNQISFIRLFLTMILFGAWFVMESIPAKWIICAGFIGIIIADAWDGLVARRHNMSTVFGIYFDPVVDQISYTALTILMIDAGLIPLWFLFIYITVTTLAGFIKNFGAANNLVISASVFAKVKADLVSVPLACLYLIQTVPKPWGIAIMIAIGMYWFLFKFIFDPSPKHTIAMRVVLVILITAFFLRPDSIELAAYYNTIYLILALVAHVGSTTFYWWDNRNLFHVTPVNADTPKVVVNPASMDMLGSPKGELL